MANGNNFNSDNKTAKRIDPFATFKFHVEIGDIKEAAFDECSGLEKSTDVFEYQEGGQNDFVYKLPGRTKYSNITLKRGFAKSNELFNWYKKIEEDLLTGKGITREQVSIILYSSAKQEDIMRWTLRDAFPVKWVGPSFKAGEAAVAIESLELAHNGITLD